jgi:serine/threonine-protein kinase HipA
MASLIVWMNGQRVGEWGTLRGGRTHFLRYENTWAQSRQARALSLALPLTADREVRGPQVESYFDNLLPDSRDIRTRIRARFQTASTSPFDLLTAIGRDCVGAVQLLPPDQDPVGWNRVVAEPLSEEEVERALNEATVTRPLDPHEQEQLRISLAGAQEKTALLHMAGKWYRPRQATPTTHILKLPLGVIGNFRGDFSDSVENEWLCMSFLKELNFPVAHTSIARFGQRRALVVTRFDRRWLGVDAGEVEKKRFRPKEGAWIARLPQEDFCQATGRPPTQKYESHGGPSITECLSVLSGAEDPAADRANFVLAQLAFWLLAAIDGHAKNFSLHHAAGGAYGMTPLYDVLSAWPVIGHGKNQLAYEKAGLAMALRGRRPHYRLDEISARHFQDLAAKAGVPDVWDRMRSLVERAAPAIDALEEQLPAAFPERVYSTIRRGVHAQVRRFGQTTPSTAR